MNKKGTEFIADIFSAITFAFVVIVFFVILSNQTNTAAELQATTSVQNNFNTDTATILRMNIEYQNNNIEFAKALAIAHADEEAKPDIESEIVSTMDNIFPKNGVKKTWNIIIKDSNSNPYEYNNQYQCNPNNCEELTATYLIPSYDNSGVLEVTFKYNKKQRLISCRMQSIL